MEKKARQTVQCTSEFRSEPAVAGEPGELVLGPCVGNRASMRIHGCQGRISQREKPEDETAGGCGPGFMLSKLTLRAGLTRGTQSVAKNDRSISGDKGRGNCKWQG